MQDVTFQGRTVPADRLIMELYNRAKPSEGVYVKGLYPETMTLEQARGISLIRPSRRFKLDMIWGRPIDIHVTEDTIRPILIGWIRYDERYGKGATFEAFQAAAGQLDLEFEPDTCPCCESYPCLCCPCGVGLGGQGTHSLDCEAHPLNVQAMEESRSAMAAQQHRTAGPECTGLTGARCACLVCS